MNEPRPGDRRLKDRDTADQELAQEAERQRDRVSRGLDGAHKPEEKFPIEEAEEAEEESAKRENRGKRLAG